jgi:hypothetical protein
MSTAGKRHYKVIGTRPLRHDGVDKVTGRAKYGADIKLAGMLYGAMLRSPHAHAKILSIDTSRAAALPGVRAIVTSADLPEQGDRIVELGEGAANMRHLSANILAREKVLYTGHAVAAVAADNIHVAEQAVGLIDVEYEPLPPVMDVRQAMQDTAPVLNDDVRTAIMGLPPPDPATSPPSNVARRFLFEKGDVARGFAEADVGQISRHPTRFAARPLRWVAETAALRRPGLLDHNGPATPVTQILTQPVALSPAFQGREVERSFHGRRVATIAPHLRGAGGRRYATQGPRRHFTQP